MTDERLSFYTEVEVEALTKIDRKTLQGWRLRGIGPPWIRAGPRLIRYPSNTLRNWLNSQPSGGELVEAE